MADWSVPAFSALPAPTRAEIARRLFRAGVPLRRHREGVSYPVAPFFCGEKCYFWRGALWYTAGLTCADTLAHEACHAILLSPEQRAAWEAADTSTDEDVTMSLQIELWRGVPGVGVGRALRWMDSVGYSYGSNRRGDREIGIRTWWEVYASDYLPARLPWEATL